MRRRNSPCRLHFPPCRSERVFGHLLFYVIIKISKEPSSLNYLAYEQLVLSNFFQSKTHLMGYFCICVFSYDSGDFNTVLDRRRHEVIILRYDGNPSIVISREDYIFQYNFITITSVVFSIRMWYTARCLFGFYNDAIAFKLSPASLKKIRFSKVSKSRLKFYNYLTELNSHFIITRTI